MEHILRSQLVCLALWIGGTLAQILLSLRSKIYMNSISMMKNFNIFYHISSHFFPMKAHMPLLTKSSLFIHLMTHLAHKYTIGTQMVEIYTQVQKSYHNSVPCKTRYINKKVVAIKLTIKKICLVFMPKMPKHYTETLLYIQHKNICCPKLCSKVS